MKKKEKELQTVLGDQVKVLEKAGVKLSQVLCQKDPWIGERCVGCWLAELVNEIPC